MIKYVTWYNDTIEKVEVVRETEKYVVIKYGIQGDRKDAKRSMNGKNYHDTWEDAQKFLLDASHNRLTDLQRQLQKEQERFNSIKKMKEITAP